MDRVLVLDKPAGVTSHDVVARVRRATRQKKVGHTGTLDPGATGVLVVLVGRATKLAQFLIDVDKEYKGYLVLGTETDTQDSDGRIIRERAFDAVTESDVRRVFSGFVGELDQVPPMVSALKHEGTPLYVLARKGIVIDRQARRVSVARLEFLSFAPPEVEFEVVCSKGTYVRTLASDIGQELGCGAHLGRLKRTRVGPFMIDDAVDLAAVERRGRNLGDAGFSMFNALSYLPPVRIEPDEGERLAGGSPVMLTPERACTGKAGSLVRVTADGVTLLAVGKLVVPPGASPGGDTVLEPVRVLAEPSAEDGGGSARQGGRS